MKIEGDSLNYEVFEKCIQKLNNPIGCSVEIGVRRGLGSALIIDSYRKHHSHIKLVHLGIDPYGNIEYNSTEHRKSVRLDYTNLMKRETLIAMTSNYEEFHLVPFTDEFYFEKFADGYPIYDYNERLITQYEIVHFDGPHDVKSIMNEINFFIKRKPQQAFYIFDDVATYDQNHVENYLLSRGFTVFEKTDRKHVLEYNES